MGNLTSIDQRPCECVSVRIGGTVPNQEATSILNPKTWLSGIHSFWILQEWQFQWTPPPRVSMTPRKRGHNPLILGNDPILKGSWRLEGEIIPELGDPFWNAASGKGSCTPQKQLFLKELPERTHLNPSFSSSALGGKPRHPVP